MKTITVIFAAAIIITAFGIQGTSATCPEKCSCRKLPTTIDCTAKTEQVLHCIPNPIPKGVKNFILDNNNISLIEVNIQLNPHIITLSLKNNTISQIKDATFQNLNKLEYLYLENNQIQMLKKHAFLGLKELKNLLINSNLIYKIDCAAFSTIRKLHSLGLSNNLLKSINKCSFEELRSLVVLDISNNQIQNIHPDAFDDLHQLQELRINNNLITEMHAQWFASKQLSLVYLSDNPWKCSCRLYQEYFKAILKTKPTEINCETDNMCLTCKSPTQRQFRMLKQVKKSNNLCNSDPSFTSKVKFSTTDKKTFTNSKINLHLSRIRRTSNVATIINCFNLICILPPGNIQHIFKSIIPVGVVSLSLASNAFAAINVTDLEGFVNLTILSVSHNKISAIDDYSFKDQAKLKTLNLENNLITSFNKNVFYGLSSLINLNLDENMITGALQTNVFQYLVNLQKLEMSFNNITTLENCAFCNLTELKQLFLQSNAITTIQKNAFQTLSNLEQLDLSNNKLTTINFFIFPKHLTLLALEDNKWICTCILHRSFDEYIYTTSLSTDCTNQNQGTCVKCEAPSYLANQSLSGLTEANYSNCPVDTTAILTTKAATTNSRTTTSADLTTTTTQSSINLTTTSFVSTRNSTTKPETQRQTNVKEFTFWLYLILAVSIPAAVIIIITTIALVYASLKSSTDTSRYAVTPKSGALSATNPSADHSTDNGNRSNDIELHSAPINVFDES